MCISDRYYVYGNTVRQLDYISENRKKLKPQRKPGSKAVRNQNRAIRLGAVYVASLTVAAVVAVFLCVQYLQLKSELQNRSENITALQEQLADLKEQNDTAYNAALDSINMEEIREKAVNELGMVYPASGQVIEYESPDGDYVRQYEEIPESGVLAQSSDVSE